MQISALDGLEANADEAARFLKLLANEHRLLILCHLVVSGEMTVNGLADLVGLSQSALSQHLAKLRDDGLVAFRRDGQTLYYRVSDQRAVRLLKTLKTIFCP
jgi:ArsR family transcriptional regulator, virulence genes transcriptional regulator